MGQSTSKIYSRPQQVRFCNGTISTGVVWRRASCLWGHLCRLWLSVSLQQAKWQRLSTTGQEELESMEKTATLFHEASCSGGGSMGFGTHDAGIGIYHGVSCYGFTVCHLHAALGSYFSFPSSDLSSSPWGPSPIWTMGLRTGSTGTSSDNENWWGRRQHFSRLPTLCLGSYSPDTFFSIPSQNQSFWRLDTCTLWKMFSTRDESVGCPLAYHSSCDSA